jgi:hypothetical protein
MSFFDSVPKPPPPQPHREARHPWQRPHHLIPATVPADIVVIRTDRVAVAIGNLRAYPNGFEFTVHARSRNRDDSFGSDADPFHRHRLGRDERDQDQVLRLGVQYADGRRTATTSWRPPRPGDETELYLQASGGGGSWQDWHQNFWLHPLPPPGPVTFVASWLAYEAPEISREIDGAAIRAAADRAVELWPEEPPVESQAGWTSQTITASRPHKAGDT